MKAGRTAVALLIIAIMAGAGSGLTAESTEAGGSINVWFYSQDGTAVYFTRAAEPGDTLAEVLDGDLPAINWWLDIATGYEWPQDKAFTKDTLLRASETKPPQEPQPEPANNDLLYIAMACAIITSTIIIIGRRFT